MLHRRHKYDFIIFLSVIGLGVSIFLATSHYLQFAVPCNVTHGCDEVLASKYSQAFGIPLAVWGGVFFLGVIYASLLANHYAVWRKLLKIGLAIGAVIALWLLYTQFFILHRICQYCLTTDTLSLLIFLWDLNIEHSRNEH